MGERGVGCLTAHSSQLPALAMGAKPDWILNWKINLESGEARPLSSPCARHVATCTSPLPLLQLGKLRHGTPLCHSAVMLLGPPRALPCPLPELGTLLLLSWRAASIGAPWAAACRLIYLFVTAGSIDSRRGGLRLPQPD